MKMYIPVPRDLTRVKTKILFNLTKRQLLCFGTGAAVGLPVYFLLKSVVPNISIATMGMLVVMLPFFALAMYEKNGQPLEVIAKQVIEAKYVRPKVRVYQTKNYYRLLHESSLREEDENVIPK